MKRCIVFLSFLLLITQGCKKVADIPVLYGKWELSASVIGFTGEQINYPKGNGKVMRFDGSNYTNFENGNIFNQGTYKIVEKEEMLTKRMGKQIIFDNNEDGRNFISIKDGKMTLYQDVYDGGSATFIKVD